MSMQMDIHEILEHLPHRYPFLLIDRVLNVEPGKNIVALKNVTMNEPFFCWSLSASSGDAGRPDHRGDGPGSSPSVIQNNGHQTQR